MLLESVGDRNGVESYPTGGQNFVEEGLRDHLWLLQFQFFNHRS